MGKFYKKNKFFLLFLLFLLSFPERAELLLQANQILLVDDFEKPVNRLGGESQVGEEFPASCTAGFVTGEEAFGKEGTSLALDYEVSAPGSFVYFLIRLGKRNSTDGTLEGANLTGMSYLSFWMRRDPESRNRNPEFLIELHEDTNGDRRFVLGSDVADRVPLSPLAANAGKGEWQKIVIPFFRFHRIRHWNRILEIAFIFEGKRGTERERLLLDNLLLGSNYPEGIKRSEIPMQNRVSSFKIGGEIIDSEMKLKRKSTSLTLTLTFIDPYLEEIRFEESRNGGQTWQRVQTFYDHSNGGIYSRGWDPRTSSKSKAEVLVRAVGVSVLGGETHLAGPYRLHFN